MKFSDPVELRFETEADYRNAILTIIGNASSHLRILDHDLSRMHLERPPAIDRLETFMNSGADCALSIALHDASFLSSQAGRLLQLLGRYPLVAEIRSIPAEFRHLADAHVLADQSHGVRRFHKDHARGSVYESKPETLSPWIKRFDELWSMCDPVSTLRHLGL